MKNKHKILSIALLLSILLSLFLPLTVSAAAVSTYSSVLDDLVKDSSFNVNAYPHDPTDYSVNVIQIAEGENGELFVYVYQPSDSMKDFKAKYINMSTQNPTEQSLEHKRYSLTWLSSYGTLDKYLVNGFTVSDEADRFYNISTVYRPYDSSIDSSSEAIDSTQCKGYKVGQYWHAYYYNNALRYEVKEIDIVEITIQATGTLRYTEGFKLYTDKCDSHYVAFSIDNYDVDEIIDADITYTLKEYHYTNNHINGTTNRELVSEKFVERDYLSSKETGSNDGDGWFGKKYTWNRIQDVATFIKEGEDDANEGFSDTELAALNEAEFVFRFIETDYTRTNTSFVSSSHYTLAEDIGILRLHFLSDGKYYNLGVVGDLVGTDSIPELDTSVGDNIKNYLQEMDAYFEDFFTFLCLIILAVIILVLIIYFKPIITSIFRGVTEICELIWSAVTLPFQLIASAFKSKRK